MTDVHLLDELEALAALPGRSDPRWAMCWSLADKLAICSATITSLAERCHGQSELLSRLAERSNLR